MKSNPTCIRLLFSCLFASFFSFFLLGSISLFAQGTAEGVPTFQCIGISWSGSGGNANTVCNVKYRVAGSGATWKDGYPLMFDTRAVGGRPANEYRGSIVSLTPGTTYEIELSLQNGSATKTITCTTWSETFPVGTTNTVSNSSSMLSITSGGTATGYKLYTPAPGNTATIDVNHNATNCIYINAPYIIIRGLILKGAKQNGIELGPNAHDIVIENNDISGWGSIASDGFGEIGDAAVRINNHNTVERIIIQRNKMHHPYSNSNSWEEYRPLMGTDHPLGPLAINFEVAGGNHVIRYNEIYSDASHYFMDGMGGAENFSYDGFPRANSDIYGNRVSQAWDDAIESEGANMNVRIWGNYLDSTYVKVAVAATSIGPVYIFRNVANITRRSSTSNPAEIDGEDRGPFIKAGSQDAAYRGGKIFVFHNTLLQPTLPGCDYTVGCGAGILDAANGPMTPVESRNNIFQIHKTWWQSIGDNFSSQTNNSFDYDLFNGAIQAAGNPESHGWQGNPVYIAASNMSGGWPLASTSQGYNTGVVLNNFNDGYIGTGPDAGAYEAGAPPLEFGVNAYLTNQPPTANAGNDITITLPTSSTTLNGSGADPDGTIASYAWSKLSGPTTYTLANANVASTALTNLVQGVYVFQLKVTDNNGATAIDNITVTVNAATAANQSPTANAGNDITITLPTNSTTLNGSGADPDGTIASYAWSKLSGPATYTLANANAASTALTNLVQGVYVFQLKVTDNNGATATDNITVTVNAATATNQPPTANAGNDIAITLPTSSTTLNGSGADPDGTIASYAWSKLSGPATYTLANANVASTALTNLVQGVYLFQLKVTDNNGATATDNITVTVNAAANQPPVANAGNDITITLPTSSTTLNGSGADPDGTIANYAWSKLSGPTTYTLANANTASTALTNLVQGVYVFQLKVTDNNGATATDNITVTVNAAANQPPVANAGNDIVLTLPTSSTTLNGSGADPDGTITGYTWSKISGPATYALANANAASTALTNLVQGVYVFQLKVTDNNGATATDNITVTVNAAPNAQPAANAGGDIILMLPVNFTTLNGSGTDPDGTITGYTWSQVSGPATYALANANAASTALTNLVQGVYVFQLKVTDNNGATATDNITITVNAAPPFANQLPTASAGNDITITLPVNSAILNGSGTDPDGTIVSYAWQQVSGPTQAAISNATVANAGVADLIVGVYVFELKVTDNRGGVATAKVTVTVKNKNGEAIYTNLYPNPATDNISVQLMGNLMGEARITLLDIHKRAVWSGTVTKDQVILIKEINIGQLSAGMYIMQVVLPGNMKVWKKFVKL